MCSFTSDFDRNRAGYSPDRLDALVWCLTELMTTHRTETKTSTIMGLI
jgi:phage terminase large subunit-like protein